MDIGKIEKVVKLKAKLDALVHARENINRKKGLDSTYGIMSMVSDEYKKFQDELGAKFILQLYKKIDEDIEALEKELKVL